MLPEQLKSVVFMRNPIIINAADIPATIINDIYYVRRIIMEMVHSLSVVVPPPRTSSRS